MPRIADTIAPNERIVCKARIRWVAYLSAVILLLVLLVTGNISGLITTELVLTNKRILGRRGLIFRKKIDVPYTLISVVRVQQGLLGKLFDYGIIKITTRNGSKILFKGIAEPYDIKQHIEDNVEVSVLGHTLSEYTAERF